VVCEGGKCVRANGRNGSFSSWTVCVHSIIHYQDQPLVWFSIKADWMHSHDGLRRGARSVRRRKESERVARQRHERRETTAAKKDKGGKLNTLLASLLKISCSESRALKPVPPLVRPMLSSPRGFYGHHNIDCEYDSPRRKSEEREREKGGREKEKLPRKPQPPLTTARQKSRGWVASGRWKQTCGVQKAASPPCQGTAQGTTL
jgi:hypothetical protein